jgi:alpha-galactosidase/6-phospho-beta-glucosidase family protein
LKKIKIGYIGGGSYSWTPHIVRDIVFKPGLEEVELDIHLMDIDMHRAETVRTALQTWFIDEWGVDRVKLTATTDARAAIKDADFIIITISTGRLKTMAHDLAIPEKYGIYHTVGDTCGPGGWSRAMRNIPFFADYAKLIKELAPNAYVLNYTNPMGALTKVLADEIGGSRVVGLCHGFFECINVLKTIFGIESASEIEARFGGMNHFFFITDLKIQGKDGYAMLRDKLRGRNFGELVQESHADAMGFRSDKWLTGELYANYGYLPYVGDRHTCEFFGCYITDKDMMERFKLKRTSIEDRQGSQDKQDEFLAKLISKEEGLRGGKTPSRETAADMIKAILMNEGFTDVVNLINTGQISNLPNGAVVETMGFVSASGYDPLNLGPLPEQIRALMAPHCDVQIRTVEAALAGDLDAALMALVADPVCAKLTATDIKKMGMELLQATKDYLPQFDL